MARARQPSASPINRSRATTFADLPGWELVGPGLADLAAGRETVEALLTASASERLRRLGFTVTAVSSEPSGRLYQLLELQVGQGRAHGRYNALRQRLASFLRAADATAT